MVFKRRNRLSWLQHVGQALYPRTGWARAIEYIGHRVKRLPGTPHSIAIGFACGVFVSFSPMFGFHFFYCAALAWMLRGNVLASIIGTFVGNPITFPFIAATSLSFGRWMMGLRHKAEHTASLKTTFMEAGSGLWQTIKSVFGYGQPAYDKLGAFWWDIFVPYFIGGLIPGLIVSVIFYFLTRPLIAAYQHRRKSKFLERAKEKIAARKADKLAEKGKGKGKRHGTGHVHS